MKERRLSGATHSFRLTLEAARIVDGITHPRRMGGKSRKVSDAIEWYFSPRGEHPSFDDLLRNIEGLQLVIKKQGIDIEALKNRKNDANTPPWWHRFWRV